MEHKLGIPSSEKSITQKHRSFNTEKQAILHKEISYLLEADVIHRVQFPQWLANPVVVPIPSGKWCVCIDFTSLNKAIPKKLYPLPRTNLLTDATTGYILLPFLDAHKGYH